MNKIMIRECDCHPNKTWGPFKLYTYRGDGDMPNHGWFGVVLVLLARPWVGYADKGLWLKVGRNHLLLFTPLPRFQIR